jgi:hypothetical protein
MFHTTALKMFLATKRVKHVFKFLSSVSGGKIDAKAAAALIAAAASGGDPDIANKIIEKMLAGKFCRTANCSGRTKVGAMDN